MQSAQGHGLHRFPPGHHLACATFITLLWCAAGSALTFRSSSGLVGLVAGGMNAGDKDFRFGVLFRVEDCD